VTSIYPPPCDLDILTPMITRQVMSIMRLLIHNDHYTPEGVPEGLTHADLIDKHLPPEISVFTVQRPTG
jgi:hypothetical protein